MVVLTAIGDWFGLGGMEGGRTEERRGYRRQGRTGSLVKWQESKGGSGHLLVSVGIHGDHCLEINVSTTKIYDIIVEG